MLTPVGLTPLETACGMPFGGATPPRPSVKIGVFEALVRDLEPLTARSPFVVWVSGDDGTAIVAAAAIAAARRAGAPPPTAVTAQLWDRPLEPYAETVVRALGLEDWIRLRSGDDLGLLGPLARDCLLRHGPMFPALAHIFVPLLEVARGGTLVAGHSMHESWHFARTVPLARLIARLRAGRRPRRADLAALIALAPLPVRRLLSASLARNVDVPYLLPAARSTAREIAVEDVLAVPLRAGTTAQRVIARACVPGAMWIYERLAADQDATFLFAWASPRVGAAVATQVGWLPPESTAAFRRKVVPSLPERSEPRRPPSYEDVWLDADTQRFIEEWDGSGLDEELIDPVELRAAWRRRDPRSAMLLQSAWLSGRRANARPQQS